MRTLEGSVTRGGDSLRGAAYIRHMPDIAVPELRRILRFVDQAATLAEPTDPFPRSTLAGLGELVPADAIVYFELRRSDRAVLAYTSDRDLDPAPGSDAALAAFGHQNPIGWRRWAPADGPKRLSELIGRHELGRLEFHDLYLRPNRIRDILKIWLASTPHAAACISLDRSGSPFSRRDAAVLAVLQGHLTAIRATALRTPLRPEGRPLTTREAQVVSWAAMGYRNEMIAARLFISAATVQKHLERAYEKLDAHSRAAAAARVLLPRYGDEDGRSEDDRRVPWLPRRPEPDRAD